MVEYSPKILASAEKPHLQHGSLSLNVMGQENRSSSQPRALGRHAQKKKKKANQWSVTDRNHKRQKEEEVDGEDEQSQQATDGAWNHQDGRRKVKHFLLRALLHVTETPAI